MDSCVAENLVIYDWLSFTSKVHTPDQLIAALGLAHVPWTDTKGARGYLDRKYFSCISIHYNGRSDMGVWVEMSGQGCRTFESLSNVGWEGIFSFIRDNGLKITRLDVAYDDHSGILNIREIANVLIVIPTGEMMHLPKRRSFSRMQKMHVEQRGVLAFLCMLSYLQNK